MLSGYLGEQHEQKRKPSKEQLEKWRNKGISQREICIRTGYAVATVCYWYKHLNNSKTGNLSHCPSREVLYDLYHAQNKNAREIGQLYGVSGGAVTKWLKNKKIRTKSLSEINLKGKRKPSKKSWKIYI